MLRLQLRRYHKLFPMPVSRRSNYDDITAIVITTPSLSFANTTLLRYLTPPVGLLYIFIVSHFPRLRTRFEAIFQLNVRTKLDTV